MKIKLWKSSMLTLMLVTGIAIAIASPVSMLQRISDRIIVSLQKNKTRLRRPGVIHGIVNRILIPHVALNRMGASVVGPRYWRAASPSQRREFVHQFKRLVISTYSAALASYDDDRVRFYPLRGGAAVQDVRFRYAALLFAEPGNAFPWDII